MNVTSPVSLFNVYLPITLPSGLLAGTSSFGWLFSSNNVVLLVTIGVNSEPGVNVTVPFWTCPWGLIEVASSAVGVSGIILGV